MKLVFAALLIVSLVLSSSFFQATMTQATPPSGYPCDSKCTDRCSKAGEKKRCLTDCGICCKKCKCVPSGTFGNQLECPCYRAHEIYASNLWRVEHPGRMGRTCGVSCGKLLGHVHVSVNLDGPASRAAVFQHGWMKLGSEQEKPTARLHLTVRSEPDPRFVFQFGGEPECSPVVFQIQRNIRQPVFSCKFRADRNARSQYLPSDFTVNHNRGWMRTFSGEREKPGKEPPHK
ncbi:hypothetical protein CsSME_00012653 [Camellia sinensis var. sinensis]